MQSRLLEKYWSTVLRSSMYSGYISFWFLTSFRYRNHTSIAVSAFIHFKLPFVLKKIIGKLFIWGVSSHTSITVTNACNLNTKFIYCKVSFTFQIFFKKWEIVWSPRTALTSFLGSPLSLKWCWPHTGRSRWVYIPFRTLLQSWCIFPNPNLVRKNHQKRKSKLRQCWDRNILSTACIFKLSNHIFWRQHPHHVPYFGRYT